MIIRKVTQLSLLRKKSVKKESLQDSMEQNLAGWGPRILGSLASRVQYRRQAGEAQVTGLESRRVG